MEKTKSFPTFGCAISNTNEDYDSEVENYFLNASTLSAELSSLRFSDRTWKTNYEEMIRYISSLSDSIINKKNPPSHDFLIKLSMGDETEDSVAERLLRSSNPVVGDLVKASVTARKMMSWYVRLSKVPRFAEGFSVGRFGGLSFLRLALTYRSVTLSK
ncbi:MAG: hypothetical protein QW597_03460 [Thermoplasmataceae archaeon]